LPKLHPKKGPFLGVFGKKNPKSDKKMPFFEKCMTSYLSEKKDRFEILGLNSNIRSIFAFRLKISKVYPLKKSYGVPKFGPKFFSQKVAQNTIFEK